MSTLGHDWQVTATLDGAHVIVVVVCAKCGEVRSDRGPALKRWAIDLSGPCPVHRHADPDFAYSEA